MYIMRLLILNVTHLKLMIMVMFSMVIKIPVRIAS